MIRPYKLARVQANLILNRFRKTVQCRLIIPDSALWLRLVQERAACD
jgi:hypothetical protein